MKHERDRFPGQTTLLRAALPVKHRPIPRHEFGKSPNPAAGVDRPYWPEPWKQWNSVPEDNMETTVFRVGYIEAIIRINSAILHY